MGLFGGGNSKSNTENYNIGTDSAAENNSGAISYGGNVNYVTTDAGAVAAGTSVANNALLANNDAVRAALDASGAMSKDAFNFGSKALDSNSSVIDSLVNFTDQVLINGANATSEALGFAKNMSTSESTTTAELMVKAMTVLGVVAVLGFILSRGK